MALEDQIKSMAIDVATKAAKEEFARLFSRLQAAMGHMDELKREPPTWVRQAPQAPASSTPGVQPIGSQQPIGPRRLSVMDAAKLIGIKPASLYAAIANGKIPVVKDEHGQMFIVEADAARYRPKRRHG